MTRVLIRMGPYGSCQPSTSGQTAAAATNSGHGNVTVEKNENSVKPLSNTNGQMEIPSSNNPTIDQVQGPAIPIAQGHPVSSPKQPPPPQGKVQRKRRRNPRHTLYAELLAFERANNRSVGRPLTRSEARKEREADATQAQALHQEQRSAVQLGSQGGVRSRQRQAARTATAPYPQSNRTTAATSTNTVPPSQNPTQAVNHTYSQKVAINEQRNFETSVLEVVPNIPPPPPPLVLGASTYDSAPVSLTSFFRNLSAFPTTRRMRLWENRTLHSEDNERSGVSNQESAADQ